MNSLLRYVILVFFFFITFSLFLDSEKAKSFVD